MTPRSNRELIEIAASVGQDMMECLPCRADSEVLSSG